MNFCTTFVLCAFAAVPATTTIIATAAPEADNWWEARRRRKRDWDEQYRPAPIWRRLLSVIALGSISLATGVMVATGIAAAIAAAAIALQSLVT